MSVNPVKLHDDEPRIGCYDKNNVAIRNKTLLDPFHDLIYFYNNKAEFLHDVRKSTNISFCIILLYYLLPPNEDDDLRDLEQLVTEFHGMRQIHSINLYYYGPFIDSTVWKTKYHKLNEINIIDANLYKSIKRTCSSVCDDMMDHYDNKRQSCLLHENNAVVNYYDQEQQKISYIHSRYLNNQSCTASSKAQHCLRQLQTLDTKRANLQLQSDLRSNRPPTQN